MFPLIKKQMDNICDSIGMMYFVYIVCLITIPVWIVPYSIGRWYSESW